MYGTDSRKEFPLTASGSGCGCCSTGASANSEASVPGVEYGLEGPTCGHCAITVEKAVAAVEGVDAAAVELVPGGRSRLVVSGAADHAAVRDAVTSAGYSLTTS